MAELDEEEDVVFKALVVEAAWVVGASWALGDKKIIGRMKQEILQHLLTLNLRDMLPILKKSGDLGRGAIASARRSIGGATSRGVGGGLARWEEYSGNLIIDLISG